MTTLKAALKGRLSQTELSLVRRSFDLIGDIAVIEIPRGLKKKAKLIGQSLLGLHKNLRVVAEKVGGHRGRYRWQKLRICAGEKRLVTEHRESGVRLRLNVERCYFSPRLASERLRIARMVKPGERILVGFSGVAPYPLVLAKHSRAAKIIGIELNPLAHRFACENVALNKLQSKVTVLKGDVRKMIPKLEERFDRLILPMPTRGASFLPVFLKRAKHGARLHVYEFAPEGALEEAAQRVRDACKRAHRSCKILRVVRAGQHAPRAFRVCVDVVV